MGISSTILLAVVGPGLLFFLVSGRSDNIKSPAGWLLAFPIGLLLAFVASFFFTVFGRQEIVSGTIAGNVSSFLDFCFWNYLLAFLTGSIWRLPRISSWWAGKVLRAEKRLRWEGKFFVSKNILEHLLCICYALKVQPRFRLVTASGKEIKGTCINYQWTEPRSLLLLSENEKKEAVFVVVSFSEIETVYLENWAEIKRKKREDTGEYLRLIDENLPEILKGKRDACGNVWDFEE